MDEIKIIVRAEVDAAIAKLNQLNTTTKNNTKSGLDFAKAIAGYTTGFGLAVQATQQIIGGMAQLTQESIKLAMGFETAKMSWGVLLGDMGAGEKMFSKIQQLAAKTPLSFESVEQGARTLKQFGLDTETIIPTIKMLGDVSMGNAEKLKGLSVVYGQIMSTGRLMGQDLLQLINQGFNPLQVISKKTGESMADLKKRMEQGKISAQEVADAFKIATSEGGLFYGMMDKTATSSAGQWSTAVDNIKMQMAAFGDNLLKIINPALKAFNEHMDNIAKNKALGDAFEKGSQMGVEALKDAIKTLEKQMADLGYTGKDSLSGIGEAYAEQLAILKQSLAYATAMESKQKAVAEAAKKAADAESARQAALKKQSDFLASVYEGVDTRYYSDQAMGAIEYAASLKTLGTEMTWYSDATRGAIEQAAALAAEEENLAKKTAEHVRLLDFMKKRDLLGGDSNTPFPTPDKKELSSIKEYINRLKEATKEYDLQVNMAMAARDFWAESFSALGESLATGEDLWKSFGNAAIDAISAVIKGIGSQLTALAVLKLVSVPPDIAGAALAGAGAAAAYAAAGALSALKLAEGGIIKARPGGTLAVIGEGGRDEAVVPLDRGRGFRGGNTIIVQGSIWSERQLYNRLAELGAYN